MRIPIIAGNWKMNKTIDEAVDLVLNLKKLVAGVSEVEIVVCPPFTAIYQVGRVLGGSNIKLGAQGVFWEETGAFTGQISPPMLFDIGCEYVIIGHSESRGRFGKLKQEYTKEVLKYFSETDMSINWKLKALAASGWSLSPIICVGETLDERRQGQTDRMVTKQVEKATEGLGNRLADRLTFAYEPVWAIGTGESCEPEEANRVIGLIREVLAKQFDDAVAQQIRILYGGSVTPENISGFMEKPEIDGALVGGASLKADSFAKIVELAVEAVKRR